MNNSIRSQILSGKLTMPNIPALKLKYPYKYSTLERMFQALWRAYLREGTKGIISSPYWAQQLQNPTLFNLWQQVMSKAGWITSYAHTAWGEMTIREPKLLEYVTAEELASVRSYHKFQQYKLSLEDHTYCDDVYQNGHTVGTLSRPGANAAANTVFQFDTVAMQDNYSIVLDQTLKGIEKVATKYPAVFDDEANYLNISDDILDYYLYNPDGRYSAGSRHSESRGRNVSGMLNKVGNPIGFKVFRSLLVIPEEYRNVATKEGLHNAYLFIAEILGFGEGTIQDKVNYGRQCYFKREYPSLDVDTEEGLKEAFEHIWISRIYNDLDRVLEVQSPSVKHLLIMRYQDGIDLDEEEIAFIETFNNHRWSVPIELDMGASILGFMGVFLDDINLMNQSNIVPSDTLHKSWTALAEGVPRPLIKVVMRKLYGSTMSMEEIWQEEGMSYTPEHSAAMAKALEDGPLSVATGFRDFLINNATMSPTMTLDMHDEVLNIECNRFHNQGDITTRYHFYNSDTGLTETIANTHTHKVPDLDSFRRYVVTALIHNRDSITEDKAILAVMKAFHWGLDLYDAIICCPEAGNTARQAFAKGIDETRANRTQILSKFFSSIGIPASAQTEWDNLMSKVTRPSEPFNCSPMVLK